MSITISSAFDAGNIRVVGQSGDTIDLEIVKDHMSDFHQWFHFRLAGSGGREVTLRIVNCGSAAYPDGVGTVAGVAFEALGASRRRLASSNPKKNVRPRTIGPPRSPPN